MDSLVASAFAAAALSCAAFGGSFFSFRHLNRVGFYFDARHGVMAVFIVVTDRPVAGRTDGPHDGVDIRFRFIVLDNGMFFGCRSGYIDDTLNVAAHLGDCRLASATGHPFYIDRFFKDIAPIDKNNLLFLSADKRSAPIGERKHGDGKNRHNGQKRFRVPKGDLALVIRIAGTRYLGLFRFELIPLRIGQHDNG